MIEAINSDPQPSQGQIQCSQPIVTEPVLSDFISSYADYADVLEVPRMLHEIVAIELVASVLNRNGVSIPCGALRNSLDLWVLMLSPSGAGRSTTVGLFTPILRSANLGDLERAVVWGSAPGLYQDFAENPAGLLIWGEMSERLQLLNQPHFSTVKPWLTDRYDNFATPAAIKYRQKENPKDTPPITFHEPPRINVLATSSEDWFFRNLAETDSAGGFLARWVIVRSSGCDRDIPIPQSPDSSQVPLLADTLAEIAELRGEADLTAIREQYADWYRGAKKRFKSQANTDLAMTYFNRHRGHVLKLAVIFEASQSRSLRVSPEAFKRAVVFAGCVEQTIFDLLPTGMSAVGYDLSKMETRIRQAGVNGMSRNRFTRSFQSMKPYDREQGIKTLLDSGKVHAKTVSTKGRMRTVYVHEVFLDRSADDTNDESPGT